MIDLVIVDDHPVVRRGIKRILSYEDDISTPDEASNIDELLHKLQKKNYHIIILDINLSGENGYLAIPDILLDYPSVKIIMLSGKPEHIFAKKCFESGAKAYISKNVAADELTQAIRKVIDGGIYSSPRYMEEMALSCLGKKEQSRIDKLSNKEFQIMILLAAGRQVGEIAVKMQLSPKTVCTYRNRIISKMNVKGISGLMKYCVEQQLV